MPFPWKKVKSSRISRLVSLSQKRRDTEIQSPEIPPEIPPEMEITTTTSKRKSRKAKIKSKMRKIVPKKLISAKRDHDFAIAYDEGAAMIDVSGCISSSASSDSGEGEGEDGDSSVCSDRGVIEEADGNGCSSEIVEPAVARRYMVLCLVALAGLVGGRPFALVLTLFCLLVFKLGQGIPVMVKNMV